MVSMRTEFIGAAGIFKVAGSTRGAVAARANGAHVLGSVDAAVAFCGDGEEELDLCFAQAQRIHRKGSRMRSI